MNIIILGAGQVGGSLAHYLSSEEKHNITIIDRNTDHLNELDDYLDIRTITGNASCPEVLQQADADRADMLIAVTNSDEVNMLACQIAYALFKVPKKIARIRQASYLKNPAIFNDSIHVDFFINPEELIKNHLKNLVEFPGVLQVFGFANQRIQLISVHACTDLKVETQRQKLYSLAPKLKAYIIAIFRGQQFIPADYDTTIKKGDEVLCIAEKNSIKPIIKSFGYTEKLHKHIIIAGGGNIGLQLAQALKLKYNVKIIEKNSDRCSYLSQLLNKVIVLHGNASDKDLLVTEAVDVTDIYMALTNDDETNIMSSMLAKQLGTKKVIALINNPAYVSLLQKKEIDIIVSPHLITTGSLLRYIRKGDAINIYSTNHNSAEVIEVVACKLPPGIAEPKISDFLLPKGAMIVAILREEQVITASKDLIVKQNDRIIIFILDKDIINKIEKIFF